MKYLITGGTGFIGQKLCEKLLETNADVRVLGRRKPDNMDSFHYWDMNEPLNIEALNGIDTVFHLAGKAHALNTDYHDDVEYFSINTAATRKLLEAAQVAGVRRFIYFSSVKAVGYDKNCIDESCCALPESMYGRSKRMAEQLVLDGGFVPEPVVIRPSMVYGNTTKGNLPKMIQAIRGRRFPPLPNTNNHRSMVHLDDVVRAAILLAEHPKAAGEAYIVTDKHSYSTRQIYEWIYEAQGRSVPTWVVSLLLLKSLGKLGDVIGFLSGRRFFFDSDALEKLLGTEVYSSDKIESELGFCAQHDLHEVLPDIVAYLEKQA